MNKKTGILLINLGTPAAATTRAVRRYLAEFLSDPLVIDVPWPLRMIILYAFILPFRPRQSAAAYQAVWTESGSPLLVNSQQFATQLQTQLGNSAQVALGMRYGKPSIETAALQLTHAGCQKIIALPLFPQYSMAATESALKKMRQVTKGWDIEVTEIESFYQQPSYHQVMATLIKQHFTQFAPEFLLFSYHGLPERQLNKVGCDTQRCDRQRSCLLQQPSERCYRAQCFATTKAIVANTDLTEEQYQTVFQSRLGKAAWIKPYTDKILPGLRQRGITRLSVICPSFVADCLETLEEIGIRLTEDWLALGGEALNLIPCLNDDAVWAAAVAKWVMNAA